MNVCLTAASAEDTSCIENLMQFYNYDLSEYYPIQLSRSGRFLLQPKQHYLSKPKVFPFLIRVSDELAGFAVIDDEVLESSTDYNMGYFFIARRFRNRGVGRIVTRQLFSRFSGRWEVYYLAENKLAGHFWQSVISEAVTADLVQSTQVIHGEQSVLFQFTIPPAG